MLPCSIWKDWELTKNFAQCWSRHRWPARTANRKPPSSNWSIIWAGFQPYKGVWLFAFPGRSGDLCLFLWNKLVLLRTGGPSWAGTGPAWSTSSLASSTCNPQCNTCTRPGSKPLMTTIPVARQLLLLSTGNPPQFSFSSFKEFHCQSVSPVQF